MRSSSGSSSKVPSCRGDTTVLKVEEGEVRRSTQLPMIAATQSARPGVARGERRAASRACVAWSDAAKRRATSTSSPRRWSSKSTMATPGAPKPAAETSSGRFIPVPSTSWPFLSKHLKHGPSIRGLSPSARGLPGAIPASATPNAVTFDEPLIRREVLNSRSSRHHSQSACLPSSPKRKRTTFGVVDSSTLSTQKVDPGAIRTSSSSGK
jgi:hypothetical protein